MYLRECIYKYSEVIHLNNSDYECLITESAILNCIQFHCIEFSCIQTTKNQEIGCIPFYSIRLYTLYSIHRNALFTFIHCIQFDCIQTKNHKIWIFGCKIQIFGIHKYMQKNNVFIQKYNILECICTEYNIFISLDVTQ